MMPRRTYKTNSDCPYCKGAGCKECEGTGHGWHQIHHDGKCWCGNYGMHHIVDQDRWLCVNHTFWWETQPDGTVIERLPMQLGPHPEAAHLHPGVQQCKICPKTGHPK